MQQQQVAARLESISSSERKVKTALRPKAGFSIIELVVVAAIILIVSGLSIPSITRMIDSARLRSASRQVAAIYYQARVRATEDNSYYNLLVSAPGTICLDLNGNGTCEGDERQAQMPPEVVLSNTGVPVALDSVRLGFTPFRTETSATYDQQGSLVSGLAWNSRGLPCQKLSATAPCSNWVMSASGAGPVGWIQYLQFQGSSNALYAAVTVSPAGKIKTWIYSPNGAGGGSWN